MKTTSMLVEVLVVGGVALLWAGPWSALVGVPLAVPFAIPDAAVAGFLVAQVYVLGLAVGFVADRVSEPISERWLYDGEMSKRDYQSLRVKAVKGSGDIAEYLHQRRSFVRLYRGNALNFTFLSATLLLIPGQWPDLPHARWRAAGVFLLALLFAWGYWRSMKGYLAFLKDSQA